MNDHLTPDDPAEPGHLSAGRAPRSRLSPLPGEPGIPDVASEAQHPLSIRRWTTVAGITACMAAASLYVHHRTSALAADAEGPTSRRVGDRPTAATVGTRPLDLMPAPRPLTMPDLPTPGARAPYPMPPVEPPVEPLDRRQAEDFAPHTERSLPEDAPAMLVAVRPGTDTRSRTSAAHRSDLPNSGPEPGPAPRVEPGDTDTQAPTRNLQAYQRQLQGLLDNLTRGAAMVGGPSTPAHPVTADAAAATASGLFDGQLKASATPRTVATTFGNRSLTLPKGTTFTCALKTRVISADSGLVGCQVQRNVYSEIGRVLLIERGSHLDGEYRNAAIHPGTVRIPVLWTRIRTPNGITVDIDSPASGSLGESGVDGEVDNRWGERIGAAMLLSLIDDSVKLVIQDHANQPSATGQSNTFVLPSTNGNASKLAEKVLDSTINIPPLIYQNQGGIVGIYVARDVDFSSVYELQPTAITQPDVPPPTPQQPREESP